METVRLNNGVEMPILGYGVYQVTPEECERCVLDAISVGYRSIDTAQAYYNEEGVGNAVRKCGVPREELFITTKVWISNGGYEKAKVSIDESLRKLQSDYVDLLLIHQPFNDYYGTYRAMEEAYKDGKARAIGVSNFYPDLNEAVEKAEKELETVKIEDEVTDVVCEECGRNMVIKYGPHGKFLACPGFPECRNTKPYLEKIGIACPKCGKDIVIRKTKKGRKYFGCEGFPDCDFMSWQKPSSIKCPECGGYMVEKGNKLVCADEHCGFVMDRKETQEKA